jgi:hypothetical protein
MNSRAGEEGRAPADFHGAELEPMPRRWPQASALEPGEECARGPEESPGSPAVWASDTPPAAGPKVSGLQIFLCF